MRSIAALVFCLMLPAGGSAAAATFEVYKDFTVTPGTLGLEGRWDFGDFQLVAQTGEPLEASGEDANLAAMISNPTGFTNSVERIKISRRDGGAFHLRAVNFGGASNGQLIYDGIVRGSSPPEFVTSFITPRFREVKLLATKDGGAVVSKNFFSDALDLGDAFLSIRSFELSLNEAPGDLSILEMASLLANLSRVDPRFAESDLSGGDGIAGSPLTNVNLIFESAGPSGRNDRTSGFFRSFTATAIPLPPTVLLLLGPLTALAALGGRATRRRARALVQPE